MAMLIGAAENLDKIQHSFRIKKLPVNQKSRETSLIV